MVVGVGVGWVGVGGGGTANKHRLSQRPEQETVLFLNKPDSDPEVTSNEVGHQTRPETVARGSDWSAPTYDCWLSRGLLRLPQFPQVKTDNNLFAG